jgi:hypothetical protein
MIRRDDGLYLVRLDLKSPASQAHFAARFHDVRSPMLDWIAENCAGSFNSNFTTCILFGDATDAQMFELRFA